MHSTISHEYVKRSVSIYGFTATFELKFKKKCQFSKLNKSSFKISHILAVFLNQQKQISISVIFNKITSEQTDLNKLFSGNYFSHFKILIENNTIFNTYQKFHYDKISSLVYFQ